MSCFLLDCSIYEYIIVCRGKGGLPNESRWFGFYFCGQLKNLEKCFQKPYQDLKVICSLVHVSSKPFLRFTFFKENITGKTPSDPYSCPLLIGEGPTNSQAFWQVLLIFSIGNKCLGLCRR
jgi:hypothetical protein